MEHCTVPSYILECHVVLRALKDDNDHTARAREAKYGTTINISMLIDIAIKGRFNVRHVLFWDSINICINYLMMFDSATIDNYVTGRCRHWPGLGQLHPLHIPFSGAEEKNVCAPPQEIYA